MNTKFMNSKNSKISDPHRLLLNFTEIIDLRRKEKYISLSNRSIYCKWKNIKKSYKNNKFKISAPTWNEEFELPDGSYSISDIQEYLLKKHGEKTVNPSIRIHINKIENKIKFKIKSGYYLELLTPETMEILGSTKSKIKKDENGENVSYLEITEVVSVHCNIVNNSYRQNSRALYTFFPNKSIGQLLDISSGNIIFLKTFDSELLKCGLQIKILIL